jgi:hypothetical protein
MWIEYLKAGGVPELLYQIRKDWVRAKCEKLFASSPECTNKNIALCYMDYGNYTKALEILSKK